MLEKTDYREHAPTDIAPQVVLTDSEHLAFVLSEFGACDRAAVFRREWRRIAHFLNERFLSLCLAGNSGYAPRR